MACISCHNPNKGFSRGLPKSVSNQKSVFLRQEMPPTLMDAGYSTRLIFWECAHFDP